MLEKYTEKSQTKEIGYFIVIMCILICLAARVNTVRGASGLETMVLGISLIVIAICFAGYMFWRNEKIYRDVVGNNSSSEH